MWHKLYGKTGKQISVIGFGGMRFTDPDNIDASVELVMHGYNKGINYFDTAPGYCNDKSEDICGVAIKQMTPGSFYISTKSGSHRGEEVRKSIDKSLRRLGVEKIDFFHIWCVATPEEWTKRKEGGAVAAALKARDEGLIDHVAVSSHLSGSDARVMLAEGFFDGVTLGYSAINFPYRDEAIDAAREMGLGVITMNPLGGGLIPQHAERFSFIKTPDDPGVVAAALRFNVSNPGVTAALVGFSSKEQIDEAVAAVENFQPYDADRVAEIRKHVLDSFDELCTGCGYCLPCPEGVNIPRMMDAYNYKILLGKDQEVINRLNWHWASKPSAAKACSLCSECEEKCTQHLPIRERMKYIADLPEPKK